MRLARPYCFVMATALLVAPLLQSEGAELVELVRTARPAVALLTILDRGGKEVSSGTGFFVSTDGRMATNVHVVESAERIEAVLADGRKIPLLGLLAEDKTNDIAIVQADFHPSPGEVLPLADLNRGKLNPGERIIVIGAPSGLGGSLSEGVVAAIRQAEDLDKFDEDRQKGREALIQITAPISPGSSGSPVLDESGQVVGVAVSQLTGGQNLNFAVPVSVVRKLLAAIPTQAVPHAFKEKVAARNLVISAVFFLAIYLGYRRFPVFK